MSELFVSETIPMAVLDNVRIRLLKRALEFEIERRGSENESHLSDIMVRSDEGMFIGIMIEEELKRFGFISKVCDLSHDEQKVYNGLWELPLVTKRDIEAAIRMKAS